MQAPSQAILERSMSSDLNIAGTQSTPAIRTDSSAGLLFMGGDSYPENSFELFGPVIEWVESFLSGGSQPLRLELELLYLNTSSIKSIMDIFDILEAFHQKGRDVAVTWYYDMRNERVGELAEEFKEDCTFPFSVVGRT
ncbi:PF09345 domain protein [Bordetella hinzii 1277]|nr:PF09345 domain protein [Bordetella hinzii 1277]